VPDKSPRERIKSSRGVPAGISAFIRVLFNMKVIILVKVKFEKGLEHNAEIRQKDNYARDPLDIHILHLLASEFKEEIS
jgi:hypothetical protein